MNSLPRGWKHEYDVPDEPGWYLIHRMGGELHVRAWGNGSWWIPLKDGWLSGIPPRFIWREKPLAHADAEQPEVPVIEDPYMLR